MASAACAAPAHDGHDYLCMRLSRMAHARNGACELAWSLEQRRAGLEI
jgi:hypothetical protein